MYFLEFRLKKWGGSTSKINHTNNDSYFVRDGVTWFRIASNENIDVTNGLYGANVYIGYSAYRV